MAPIKRKSGSGPDSRPSKKPKKEPIDGKKTTKDTAAKVAAPPKPSTNNNRQNNPSVLREEEVSFPRGGASLLTPLEHKQIQIEATRDVLFEQDGAKKAKDALRNDENASEVGTASKQHSSTKTPKSKKWNGKAQAAKEDSGIRIEGLSYKVGNRKLILEPWLTIVSGLYLVRLSLGKSRR